MKKGRILTMTEKISNENNILQDEIKILQAKLEANTIFLKALRRVK